MSALPVVLTLLFVSICQASCNSNFKFELHKAKRKGKIEHVVLVCWCVVYLEY